MCIDVGFLQSILNLILTVIGLIFVIWQAFLYVALKKNRRHIEAKEKEYDDIVKDINRRTTGQLVTERQRLAQIEKGREPLRRDMELLKQKREFIKDILLFAKK